MKLTISLRNGHKKKSFFLTHVRSAKNRSVDIITKP